MVTPTDERLLAGRYRLGEVLGRGAMGEVRDGFDLRLERAVAVKLLSPEMAHDPAVRARFEAEARAAARLCDHRVVAVYDSGTAEDGTPFLVMERVDGGTLADEIARGPLTLQRAAAVVGDVLGALGVAHEHGLIHRDIKPSNVLLSTTGRAKVADFGIAKSLGSSDVTQTGLVLGTVAYLAPERIEGQRATVQSDLFAAGVLLFEVLAGRRPWDGATPLAVLAAMRTEPIPSVRALRPEVPAAVDDVVARALAPRPAERYADAASMAAALEGSLRDDATVVPVPGLAAGPTIAMATTPTVAAGAPASWPAPPGPLSAPEPAVTTVGLRPLAAAGAIVLAALLLIGGVALAAGRDPGPRSPSGTDPAVTTTAPLGDAPPAAPVETDVTTTAPPATRAPAAPSGEHDEGQKGKGGKGKGKGGHD